MFLTKSLVWLTLAMSGLAGTAAAQGADAGLRCSFSSGSPMVAGRVDCTVYGSEVTVLRITFNRGNCPARFDDPLAERAYYEFWGNTAENRAWWAGTNYHRTYKFGERLRVEASGSCGDIGILEYEIQATAGTWKWTVSR